METLEKLENKFKEQMITDFIPRVKVMLEKEREHLDKMKERKAKRFEKKGGIFSFLFGQYEHDLSYIDAAIDNSEKMVGHIKFRLAEYEEYVSKL